MHECCYRTMTLFGNLARAGKAALATAHMGVNACPFVGLMLTEWLRLHGVSCFRVTMCDELLQCVVVADLRARQR